MNQTLSGNMSHDAYNGGLVMQRYIALDNHPNDSRVTIAKNNIVQTITQSCGAGGGNTPMVMEQTTYSMGHDERSAGFTPECADPLTASDYKQPTIVNQRYIVRRLTPREAERLQGLPDDFTLVDGATDSKRYKAIGNGMAHPCASYVLGQVAKALRE